MTENPSIASFKSMPLIPYVIIEKLAEDESVDANNIWKLLKYTTTDALKKDDLTYEEKMNMVWTPDKENSTQQNLFNIFLKPLVSSSLNTDESQSQLKIFRYKTTALDQMTSILLYEFDLLVNEVSCMVFDLEGRLLERTDVLESLLLEVLNGLDLGVGSSFLTFTRMQGGQCESLLNISNSKSLYGRSFLLALRYHDSSKGGACN